MPIFSIATLSKFEDASAGIPLRHLVRAFERAAIHMGEDPGGSEGRRRTQFRRYVAGVDQHEPQDLDRLGDALGALIAEVAASKVDFLERAAESDGFSFANGVFRPVEIIARSFTVTRLEDLQLIDDRARRLHLLASHSPRIAIDGAKELVESTCRTVLRLRSEPLPQTTDLIEIATATLDALGSVSDGSEGADADAEIVRSCVLQLGKVVALLGTLRDVDGSDRRRDDDRHTSTSHARLAVGAAVIFSGFVAESYSARTTSQTVRGPSNA